MNKEIGVITHASIGQGGYQEAMFGFSVSFKFGECLAVGWFDGTWAGPPMTGAKWTVADQDAHFAKVCRRVIHTLEEAKVSDVSKLPGVPVELTLDGGALKEWRVLTEAIR